ncbi:bile acid:sodium symporter family protein [Novosphingobium sp.]|uniref:bile acid:sodium symporter family protein n=1 Tax=Novosphingobium sp. TaxID=1874826 RepID=UPI001EB6AC40|nr:bile acid:sodium symporter family protein [Novosphingobium sp.]MBK6801344.1 bile acid:sodium symporter [Novosphingobium sp.]MBK9010149.1 bile acid:sodium symporter [Novosphingobium sp.]
MVRLLMAAIALAIVLPVSGTARDAAQFVSNAAVFLLFFLNGLRLPRHEVMAGLGNHRLLWPLVLWCFGAMALAGWALWQAGQGWMPPLLALGFLYLGCLPSTVQSATAYSSLAGGNVAGSVVAAALLNLLGVFVTAPLFSLLAGGGAAEFHADGLLKVVGILLVPFILGQIAQQWLGGWVRDHRPLVTWMDRSSIAIAVYVAFSGAVAQQFWTLIDLAGWFWLAGGTVLMLAAAHWGAWVLGGALRLDRPSRITMLFAGAQKSIAMGAPLATVLFAPEAAGIVLLPILLYHLVQLVLAAPLAARLNPT